MNSAVILYHFLPPDDVVSAVLFGELAADLASRGWKVTAYPSNRDCQNASRQYSATERWRSVDVRRIWRPRLSQWSGFGRLFNALWMIARWSLLSLDPEVCPDVLVIGSDPILSVLTSLLWRRFKPKTRIVHWCFDLYPEAAIADGIVAKDGLVNSILAPLLKRAYAACDLVVDIGPCMRERLAQYGTPRQAATLVPWALQESGKPVGVCSAAREAIFGDAQLALLYSGSFGRAHSCSDLLELTREMRPDRVKLAFSVRGSSLNELHEAIQPDDHNIVFTPFVAPEFLLTRLSAADIHVVSLRGEWSGTVVPSKFFGALAASRPVLFCGSRDSAIAQWIVEFNVGWVLAPGEAPRVAKELREFMANPERVERTFRRCHAVYQETFSKAVTLDEWNRRLCGLVNPEASHNQERVLDRLVSPMGVPGHSVEEPSTVWSRD